MGLFSVCKSVVNILKSDTASNFAITYIYIEFNVLSTSGTLLLGKFWKLLKQCKDIGIQHSILVRILGL